MVLRYSGKNNLLKMSALKGRFSSPKIQVVEGSFGEINRCPENHIVWSGGEFEPLKEFDLTALEPYPDSGRENTVLIR